MTDIQLACIPAISAIYYALLQNGYEFCHIERDEATVQKLREFAAHHEAFPYFAHSRQSSCEVYPYWPRAALLETASFFLEPGGGFIDIAALRQLIHSFSNITDSDRDSAFWTWLMDFPAALRDVQSSKGFHEYLQWERSWLEAQSRLHTDDLATIQKALRASRKLLHASQVHEIEIVISPIKCVHSADFHLFEGRFIFSSGRFTADSVIHESLHPAVHPLVLLHRDEILSRKRRYDGIDSSYYLNDSDEGYLNAFEEALVRSITACLMAEETVDLQTHMTVLLS